MSILSLSYWESDVYWRQNNKHFAELAPQNGGKLLIWRNYVTIILCIDRLQSEVFFVNYLNLSVLVIFGLSCFINGRKVVVVNHFFNLLFTKYYAFRSRRQYLLPIDRNANAYIGVSMVFTSVVFSWRLWVVRWHSRTVIRAAQGDEPQQHKDVHWGVRGAGMHLLPHTTL